MMFKCQTKVENYYKLYLCTTVKVYSVVILSEDTLHGISEKGKSIFLIDHCSIEQCEFDNDSLLILLLKLIF